MNLPQVTPFIYLAFSPYIGPESLLPLAHLRHDTRVLILIAKT